MVQDETEGGLEKCATTQKEQHTESNVFHSTKSLVEYKPVFQELQNQSLFLCRKKAFTYIWIKFNHIKKEMRL